jgi:hypothetical protein
MEATISEPATAGVRSAGETSKRQSQGSSLLLARFSAAYRYLSLKYKYGKTLNISGRQT